MAKLKEGDPAPDFAGVDQYGKEVRLSDFSGKKLVLYFYPKDNTPGCTAEACNLRDHHEELNTKGYEVLGVSADSVNSHVKFSEKFNLPFRLMADTNKEIIKAYGAWGPKKFMGRAYDGIIRTTFIIDEKSRIEKIISKVKTGEHAGQVMGTDNQ